MLCRNPEVMTSASILGARKTISVQFIGTFDMSSCLVVVVVMDGECLLGSVVKQPFYRLDYEA